MEWIFFTIAAMLITALLLGMVKRRPSDQQAVQGQFNCDKFKARELSRRGLHDRTKRG